MTEPTILMPNDIAGGRNNADLKEAAKRLKKQQTYRDLSTVIIVPTRGGPCLTPRWVNHMNGLMKPMNNRVAGPIFVSGMEVGSAYNWAIEWILKNLPDYKYMLTWEDDVLPPPDGLLKLYEGIDDFDAVGALYWTKGEFGQPMIYGDPNDPVLNFRPQMPQPNCLQRTYGLGMGFNLFRMSMFKKVEGPWFVTEQRWDPNVGVRSYTQDLHFYEKAGRMGFKFACDTRVRAAHLDVQTDTAW